MSLRREEHPCWLVVCDHCGEGDNTEYGGSFHHQSEEGAREAAREVEMEVSPAGAVLCLTCIEECWMIVGCPKCDVPVDHECPDPDGGPARVSCDERIAAALATFEVP